MEKVIDNIYMKKIIYFNLYVIKGTDGDILIDTGFFCMKKSIKKWLDKFNIKLIILTHAHIDHSWNVAYIKKLYNCEVALGKKDLVNINNKNINTVASKKRYKLFTELMKFGMKTLHNPLYEVDYLLKDKEKIKKYGLELQIHNLAGHTNGSIGILYKDYLFVGDALVNRLKVSIAFQNQNVKKAIKSSEKIMRLTPKMVFFGHDKEVSLEKLLKDLNPKTKKSR